MSEIDITPEFRSFPPAAWGTTTTEFLAQEPTLADFQTPVLTLERPALDNNVAVMAEWLRERGFEIAPHGKTTMAPQLWQQLLDAGAWGITLATPWQVQLARFFGVTRIILANTLVDPAALRWLAEELSDDSFEFSCWVDSQQAIQAMEEALDGIELPRPIDVLVELGAPGGRTGARSIEGALGIADAAMRSPYLRVVGVGGYEGSLAHDRKPASVAVVTRYLDELVLLNGLLKHHYEGRTPIVTAGGSAYFDVVADRFAPLAGHATVVLRSGAYQVHDDGFYAGISPLASHDRPLVSAMHGWARVVSRPERGLALLDGGKRDFPIDEGLPVAQLVVGLDDAENGRVLGGSRVVALNDQHTHLHLAEHVNHEDLPVGAIVRFGLSHPCTAMDKWRLIPVIDNASTDDPRVIDVVRTWF